MNSVYMLSIHCAFDERSALPTCGVAHSLVSYKHQKAQVDHMSPYAWCGYKPTRLCVHGGIWGRGLTSHWSNVDLMAEVDTPRNAFDN